jgi:hypothetical protein
MFERKEKEKIYKHKEQGVWKRKERQDADIETLRAKLNAAWLRPRKNNYTTAIAK